jgi:hypothetical protein
MKQARCHVQNGASTSTVTFSGSCMNGDHSISCEPIEHSTSCTAQARHQLNTLQAGNAVHLPEAGLAQELGPELLSSLALSQLHGHTPGLPCNTHPPAATQGSEHACRCGLSTTIRRYNGWYNGSARRTPGNEVRHLADGPAQLCDRAHQSHRFTLLSSAALRDKSCSRLLSICMMFEDMGTVHKFILSSCNSAGHA